MTPAADSSRAPIRIKSGKASGKTFKDRVMATRAIMVIFPLIALMQMTSCGFQMATAGPSILIAINGFVAGFYFALFLAKLK